RGAAPVPARQGQGRQAWHENRRGFSQMDRERSRRGAQPAVALSRRTGQGTKTKRAASGRADGVAPCRIYLLSDPVESSYRRFDARGIPAMRPVLDRAIGVGEYVCYK